uniref:E3 ubiquitin-protein ligase RNF25 isoform X2 n=1 Tax=Elaeis guineensis var. tenera TaxID=51953 RepID=A0A6I9R3B1_ELAGV|nr:E3 ubiquitin-protein ligase RNF25 isoform X2 [Elaeis guineensis]
MAMVEEEEVRLEVEAVQAVYGDDCRVILDYPPHLNVRIRPRTADDSSQQFVEVILGIKSFAQYPGEPPHIYPVDTKGLDENRQTCLIASIQNKAQELSSCMMLVALCEEAVEMLSSMNHPEGNCPLCLCPLTTEDKEGSSLPFMKLMSCYHCFHSECIIRWWKWLQEQNETKIAQETTAAAAESQRDMPATVNQHKGTCPVCRKVFDVKDIEHVLDYLETNLCQLRFAGVDIDEDDKLFLQSELENKRRQKFEALLKLQQENNGLIEPTKNLQILPGMFLPELLSLPPTSVDTRGEPCGVTAQHSTLDSNTSMNKATTSKQKNTSMRRKNSLHNSRKQKNAQPARKQWIKKEAQTSEQ